MNGNKSLRTTADNGGQGVLELEFFIYDYLSYSFLRDGVGIIVMVRNSCFSSGQTIYHFSLLAS